MNKALVHRTVSLRAGTAFCLELPRATLEPYHWMKRADSRHTAVCVTPGVGRSTLRVAAAAVLLRGLLWFAFNMPWVKYLSS